jgi:hypothetical protein
MARPLVIGRALHASRQSTKVHAESRTIDIDGIMPRTIRQSEMPGGFINFRKIAIREQD